MRVIAHSVDAQLRLMKYQDVKDACIVLNMPFEDVSKADWHGLKSYYARHYGGIENPELLEEFDSYTANSLISNGHSPDDPLVKYRPHAEKVGEEEDTTTLDSTPLKTPTALPKKKKGKRERDSFGGFKGTKKSYVYLGVSKGATIDKVIDKTLKKFPDAKEKSIRIWFKKATKELADK